MPFTNRISKINNTQVDDAHVIDVVVPMYKQNIVVIIQKHLEFYGNILEMYLPAVD